MKSRAHVLVSGRVHGVYYRANTQAVARRLGITGWVKNLTDGRVEAIFEGDRDALEHMVAWCKEGPTDARVDSVDVKWGEYSGNFKGFEIAI